MMRTVFTMALGLLFAVSGCKKTDEPAITGSASSTTRKSQTQQPSSPTQTGSDTTAASPDPAGASHAGSSAKKTLRNTQQATNRHINDEQGGGGDCFFHSLTPAANEVRFDGTSSWTQQAIRNRVAQDLGNKTPWSQIKSRLDIMQFDAEYGPIYQGIDTLAKLKSLVTSTGHYQGDIFIISLVEEILNMGIVMVDTADFDNNTFQFRYENTIKQYPRFTILIGGNGHFQAFPFADTATGNKTYTFQYSQRQHWPLATKQLMRALFARNSQPIDF